MQIAQNIYSLHIPLPDKSLKYLNSYLLKSDDGCVLIDTGWNTEEAYESLLTQLANFGVNPNDLKYIVVTHFHPDHYGLIGRLSKISHASVIQHKNEYDILNKRQLEAEKTLSAMESWLVHNGLPEEVNNDLRALTLDVYKLGNNGAQMQLVSGSEHFIIGNFELEVIWTPGHSPGMICLYEKNHKILFSADHVLAHTTPNISKFLDDGGDPLADYLKSLQKISTLPATLTLPAHGNSIHNLSKRVEEMINHHENRLLEMLSACRHDEPKSACQIASSVTWSIGPWVNMPSFHQRFAVLETLSHLEYLRYQGYLDLDIINKVRLYRYNSSSPSFQTTRKKPDLSGS